MIHSQKGVSFMKKILALILCLSTVIAMMAIAAPVSYARIIDDDFGPNGEYRYEYDYVKSFTNPQNDHCYLTISINEGVDCDGILPNYESPELLPWLSLIHI